MLRHAIVIFTILYVYDRQQVRHLGKLLPLDAISVIEIAVIDYAAYAIAPLRPLLDAGDT